MTTAPLRIAVADDEPDIRDYYARILPRLGHCVVAVASTGADLLEQCRASSPDLVITDIKMPDLDGVEAAARLHQQRPVAVILASAYHDPELLDRAGSRHVMGYLVKPIKQADLAPAIERAMERFEQARLVQESNATRMNADGTD